MLYRDCKDQTPGQTIARVERILAANGLDVEELRQPASFGRLHASRLVLAGTPVGVNGKGVSPELARASALAEFLERHQNHILWDVRFRPEAIAYRGFRFDVDERPATPPAVRDIAPRLGVSWLAAADQPPGEACGRYATWLEGHADSDRLLPYFDLRGDRVAWLPYQYVLSVFSSNGMAAGNSPEEALVQALCEIFERHAIRRLFFGEETPPDVHPDLVRERAPEQADLIRLIEQTSGLQIRVMECSLEAGLPVVAVVIVSLKTRRYTLKLGSDPCFHLALERCLTEVFQGVHADGYTGLNPLQARRSPERPDNDAWHEAVFSGIGEHPPGILYGSGAPPVTRLAGFDGPPLTDQRSRLRHVLAALDRLGGDVFIRDASFLGFPAVQVLVPGLSEVYGLGRRRRELLTRGFRRMEMLGRAGSLSRTERERVADDLENHLLVYDARGSLQLDHYLGTRYSLQPDTGSRLQPALLLALLRHKLGQGGAAIRAINRLLATPGAGDFLHLAGEYLVLVHGHGRTPADAAGALAPVFGEEPAEDVRTFFEYGDDRLALLEGMVPCWGCEGCARRPDCGYDRIEQAYRGLKDRIASNPIDQLRVRDLLS